jgi:hypothetical protein
VASWFVFDGASLAVRCGRSAFGLLDSSGSSIGCLSSSCTGVCGRENPSPRHVSMLGCRV